MTALTHKEVAAAYDEGRTLYRSWSKAPTQTTASGIWFDLSMSPGNPPAQYYGGSPLVGALLKRSTDGGIDHGEDKAGYTKHLHTLTVQTVTATAAPLTLQLMDYLAFWSGIGMDAGVQTFTTSQTVLDGLRYGAADGAQMMLVEQFPYAGGATIQVTYKNQNNETKTTPVVTLNTQVTTGTVASSAPTTAGAGGLFLPLASGDSGVAYPESIEIFGAGDVGVLSLVMVKPLCVFNIFETTAPAVWDFLLHQKQLPRIRDDAYLNLAALPVGTLAASSILGDLTTIWRPV